MTIWITAAFLFITASQVSAEEEKQVIEIQADQMYFDLQKDKSIYTGHVKVKQGSMELFGDRVDVSHEDDKIISLNATGSPAIYKQVKSDGTHINGQSNKINYLADKDQLVMIDKAILVQGEQTIESERIIYDTKNETLIAGKASDSNGDKQRVKITLTPNEEKP